MIAACLCGHKRWEHIQWRGNCKACPMTISRYRISTGRHLAEPACTKYRDILTTKLKKQAYDLRYWRVKRYRAA